MFHIWTKPNSPGRRRPIVAVIDHDDASRRAALRALRQVHAADGDVAGVGLLDTAAAFRWVTLSSPVVVVVDRARVPDLAVALEGVPPTERPLIVAVSEVPSPAAVAGADAVVCKPLHVERFVTTLESLLLPGGAPRSISAQDQAAARRKRVLLVDDDEDIRETFCLLLEDEGYDVVPVPHGVAAWKALEGGLRPDVILLDLMMPMMNGHEMYARLRSSPYHRATPVVVITASGPTVSVGSAPVLRKPIEMRDLLDAVERAAA